MNYLMTRTDGSPWTPKQVFFLLRHRNLVQDEINPRSASYECLEEHAFGNFRATIARDSEGLWTFRCQGCRESKLSDGPQRLESWLNKLGLDGSGLRPHYNPMEAADAQAELGLLFDSAGRGLLYRGLIHFLYGKPGTLKSWVALSLVGLSDCRFWDFENGVAVTGARLHALGTPIEKAAYFDSPLTQDEIRSRVKQYLTEPPEVVIIDGFSGLAGVLELDPDSNQDVLRIFTDVLVPLRRAGITVLVLDHLPKDSGTEDYPIGAQSKKSQSDVTLLVRQVSRGAAIELFITKDRIGALSQRAEDGPFPKKLGEVSLSERQGLISLTVAPYRNARLGQNEILQSSAALMESIWNYLSENPDSTQTDIENGVKGRRDNIRQAIDVMAQGGYLIRKQIGRMYSHSAGRPLGIEYDLKG